MALQELETEYTRLSSILKEESSILQNFKSQIENFKTSLERPNEILPILDLGNQPLANSLKKEKTQSETFFSLEICQCKKCSVIQLTETIDAKLLFNEYVCVTGTSKIA